MSDIRVRFSKLESGYSIISRWWALMGLFCFLPILLGSPYLTSMIKTNGALAMLAAFVVFAFCVWKNYGLITELGYEYDVLNKYRLSLGLGTEFDGDSTLSRHCLKLKAMWLRSGKKSVSQDNLVEILHTKLKKRNYLMTLFSGLLITFGLIGTIVGLIGTVGGLGQVVEGNGDSAALMVGMKNSIAGMGTAFYTTLVGALLGGVTLKLLHAYTDNKITVYISELAEAVEVRLLPKMQTSQAQEIAEALVNVLKEKEDETSKLRIIG